MRKIINAKTIKANVEIGEWRQRENGLHFLFIRPFLFMFFLSFPRFIFVIFVFAFLVIRPCLHLPVSFALVSNFLFSSFASFVRSLFVVVLFHSHFWSFAIYIFVIRPFIHYNIAYFVIGRFVFCAFCFRLFSHSPFSSFALLVMCPFFVISLVLAFLSFALLVIWLFVTCL